LVWECTAECCGGYCLVDGGADQASGGVAGVPDGNGGGGGVGVPGVGIGRGGNGNGGGGGVGVPGVGVGRGGNGNGGGGLGVGDAVGNVVLDGLDGHIDGLVDGDGVGGDNGLLVVGGVGGVVHMGGLNDLLDGVDLVRGSHGDGTGNRDLVRGRDVLVHNHGALNGDGHMDGHVNVVVLDLNLGDDVGLLRGDPGVGPHRGEDLLLDNGVSRGRASRDRCRGDGSHVGGSVGDDWGRQRAGLGQGLGSSSDVAAGRLGNDLLASRDVGVTSDHAGVSGLHNLASDNSVLCVLLNHCGASGVGLVGLTSDDWGRGNGGTLGNSGTMGDTNVLGGAGVAGVANGGHTVVKVLGCA